MIFKAALNKNKNYAYLWELVMIKYFCSKPNVSVFINIVRFSHMKENVQFAEDDRFVV